MNLYSNTSPRLKAEVKVSVLEEEAVLGTKTVTGWEKDVLIITDPFQFKNKFYNCTS